MAKPERSPERAAKILDRAARMRAFKPSLLDRRLFDRQMRTPGFDPRAMRPDVVDGRQIKRLGVVDIPLDKIRTSQPTISLAAAKGKLRDAGSPPQAIRGPNGMWTVNDGNHRITAARALGKTSIKAYGGEIMPAAMGKAASTTATMAGRVAASYQRASPILQVGGILASAGSAYQRTRENNGTRLDAIKAAGGAAAPAAAIAAAVPLLASAAPGVAKVLAKANPIAFGGAVAYSAAKGAWEGYHAPGERSWSDWASGKPAPVAGVKGAIKGAAFGVADTLTFGLASAAAGREWKTKKPDDFWTGGRGAAAPVRLDAGDRRAFAAADAGRGSAPAAPAAATRGAYKDTWTDSRGRSYTRKNMAVRTRKDMATP